MPMGEKDRAEAPNLNPARVQLLIAGIAGVPSGAVPAITCDICRPVRHTRQSKVEACWHLAAEGLEGAVNITGPDGSRISLLPGKGGASQQENPLVVGRLTPVP